MANQNLHLKDDEIQKAFEFQKENNVWNFYNERAFIEQLLCTRFSYFLVTIGIFLGGALTTRSYTHLLIILSVGLVFISLMAIIIYRAFIKLIIILKMLYRLGDQHVFSVVGKEVELQHSSFSIPVNHIIGMWIPFGAVGLFFIGLLLAISGILTPVAA